MKSLLLLFLCLSTASATIHVYLADGRCFTNDLSNSSYPDGGATFQGQNVYPCATAAPTDLFDGKEELDEKVVRTKSTCVKVRNSRTR